jgi:hypothetical protein
MIDFEEDSGGIDFQLDFQPDEEGSKVLGGLDAAAAMFAGTPAQIAGGLMGMGAILTGQGVDAANKTLERVQKSNFGLGEYKPATQKGKEYSENVSSLLEKPVEWSMKAGEAVAGNEGAYVGELLSRSLMELIDPTVGLGMVAKGMQGRKPKVSSKPQSVEQRVLERQAAQEATAKIDFQEIPNLTALEGEGGQMSLFDIPESGRMPNPTEAVLGDWRVDENGIPIKADLSMEAANTENVLQKGLWGDELPPKHPQEQLPITQAMDETRQAAQSAEDLQTADTQHQLMTEQIDLLRGEIEDVNGSLGSLKASVIEANSYLDPKTRSGDPMIVPKSQRGAINPAVFKEGFEKLKQLADGTWLRAFYEKGLGFTVEAIKDGHKLGHVVFDKRADWSATVDDKFADPIPMNLEAFSTSVKHDNRRSGIASEMYKFAAELGNDIQPSASRTKDGKGMWQGFENKGLANGGRIKSRGNKQMGAIRLGEKKQQQLEKVLGKDKDTLPPNPDSKAAVEEALQEGKDSKQWIYTESGSSLAAMKRASVAVLAASRIIQNAIKRADLAIREMVFPVEAALRGLSSEDLVSLASIMKQEMFTGHRIDPTILTEELSTKQLEAYNKMRRMFEDTLRIQNEARAAKGKKPITEVEAYLSSRWEGDFRRPVYQDGKLVWYLAANTKHALNKQWDALHRQFPDVTFDPKKDHTVRYYKRQTDLQSTYSTILDILDTTDDHPAIQKIKAAIEEQAVNEGASFLNQEKHFKPKANIRGFVGDRPSYPTLWGLMKKHSPRSEALAMFQQQIAYAKNAYKWSEMQVAAQDLKPLVSDPRLVEQQPNNVKYIKEYYKNAVGYGEATAMAHVEDSLRNLGMSPTVIDNALGGVKTYFILSKLAVSTGYTIANILQTANVLPHLFDLRNKGYKGNPLSAMAVGIASGMAMATGHQLNALRGQRGGFLGLPEGHLLQRAFQYAEDNGVTARSVYDESPIESSFSTLGKVGNVAGKTMSIPESFVRSMSFMSYVQMLNESGKFKGREADMFQIAEERVNASMVDYRAQERPMMFAKAGIAGNVLNTLQTYPVNWYNQWNYFGREAAKGNVMPLISAMALQYAVAGAMGIPGFYDMTELYTYIKDHMISTGAWTKAQENDFLADPKLWMVKNFGQSSVYGVLSDQTGIGMTSRVAAPGAGQMLQSPAGPAMDIAKQVGNVAKAAVDPTNTDKWAQAAMSAAPVGAQGLLETAPFMQGKTYEKRGDKFLAQRTGDIEDHRGIYLRSPEEQSMRKYGMRSQSEVVGREIGWNLNKTEGLAREKGRNIVDSFYSAVKRGDQKRVQELAKTYTELTGNPIGSEQMDRQVLENYRATIERSQSAARTVVELRNVARMTQLLKELREKK